MQQIREPGNTLIKSVSTSASRARVRDLATMSLKPAENAANSGQGGREAPFGRLREAPCLCHSSLCGTCRTASDSRQGGRRGGLALPLRRIALAAAFLAIQATGPEAVRAMQEQPAPGCIVVSPAEPDTMRQAREIQRQTVLAATGVDALGVANAWLRRPVFSVRYESVSQTLRVSVEEIPDAMREPAAYPIRLALEAGALGATERFDATLRGPSEAFDLPFPYRARFVAVRPEEPSPMQIRVDQTASGWIAQLRYASFPAARLAAAEALRSLPSDPALIIGLRTALSEEPDNRVRAAIARTIARRASGGAADRALAVAGEDPSPAVRKAVFASLDQARSSAALIALALRAAQTDPDQAVQAEAVRALANMGAAEALLVARSALITPSRGEIIRIAGLDALGTLHAYAWSPAEDAPQAEPAATASAEPLEIPVEALTEGLQFATPDWPLPLRNAARRLFLRIRRYEPTATYGAAPSLHALQPCP